MIVSHVAQSNPQANDLKAQLLCGSDGAPLEDPPVIFVGLIPKFFGTLPFLRALPVFTRMMPDARVFSAFFVDCVMVISLEKVAPRGKEGSHYCMNTPRTVSPPKTLDPKKNFPLFTCHHDPLLDHGKTTLVDAMLQQSSVFRDNEQVRFVGASTMGWVCLPYRASVERTDFFFCLCRLA